MILHTYITHTGSTFSREIRGGLCLPWLDGDWCFRVAPRNAFTRFVGFAYDATFTDNVRSPTHAVFPADSGRALSNVWRGVGSLGHEQIRFP